MLIIAMDTNFRLKNLMRSSLSKDPGLHTGLAFFPEDGPYRKHILKYASQKDVRTLLLLSAKNTDLPSSDKQLQRFQNTGSCRNKILDGNALHWGWDGSLCSPRSCPSRRCWRFAER
jgi:hypothetical protein